jgi:lipoprotein-anchoring transpeptidase ErfK/SrfK
MKLRTLYFPYSLSKIDFAEDKEHPLVGEIQQLLTDQQLYNGPIHNCYDTETSHAVALFQEKEHLPVTSIVDPLTYCRLHEAHTTPITNQAPAAKRADFSLPRANILIAESARQLTLFDGNTPLRQYPVGIGKTVTPTPLGNFSIALKLMNPGGVLGTRWLGLSLDGYGIHGTNQPWLIGTMVSHGCIRMHNSNVEELYTLVKVGTPVYIRN